MQFLAKTQPVRFGSGRCSAQCTSSGSRPLAGNTLVFHPCQLSSLTWDRERERRRGRESGYAVPHIHARVESKANMRQPSGTTLHNKYRPESNNACNSECRAAFLRLSYTHSYSIHTSKHGNFDTINCVLLSSLGSPRCVCEVSFAPLSLSLSCCGLHCLLQRCVKCVALLKR